MTTTPRRSTPAILACAGALALVLYGGACTSGSTTVATTTTAPTTTLAPEATTTTEIPLAPGRELSVYNPEPGQCFDQRVPEGGGRLPLRTNASLSGGEVVVLVDCGAPHQYEIMDVVALPSPPTDRPGDETLSAEAKKICPARLTAFVGVPYERSTLETGWLLPTDEEWRRGRRDIACLVFDPNAVVSTASLKGAAR